MKKILFCTAILLATGIVASCYNYHSKACMAKRWATGMPKDNLLFLPGIPGIIID